MDQEKIGKFIANCRKKKNMTQLDLANKLGVTDRAISKWENGRGLPDLALIKPLCKELAISLNEFLSGEEIKDATNQENLEQTILNTIDYTGKKITKMKQILKVFLITIGIVFLTLVSLFIIDIKRMNQNEPVFFSTWGFDYTPSIDLSEEEIYLAIENYLLAKNENQSKHYNNEKWFVSLKIYLIEETKNTYQVAAFALEESYYLENKEIKQDSGSAIPYKFTLKKENNQYKVIKSEVPRDGNLYQKDLETIFSKSVRNDLDKVYTDGTIERLKLDIEKQVNLYFHQ